MSSVAASTHPRPEQCGCGWGTAQPVLVPLISTLGHIDACCSFPMLAVQEKGKLAEDELRIKQTGVKNVNCAQMVKDAAKI